MTDTRFIDKFEENVRLYPDKVILRDQDTSLTFRELDALSGRVYAYLKQQGIGREDFVMICLPRSVKCCVAMIGVWKAGAAMVLFEDNAPAERIKYVINDCNCKLSLTMDNWQEIMDCETLPGHEMTDEHDAAYALYTSGSEGTPKGVLHEYGKINLSAHSHSVEGKIAFLQTDVFGAILPLNSTSMIDISFSALYVGATIQIVPYEIMLRLDLCVEYHKQQGITIAGIPPSYFKEFNPESGEFRVIFSSTEMANGIFLKNIPIINFYGQTEGSMCVASFVIDKPYKNTPIGKPTCSRNLVILDDEENPVPTGEIGELCYDNPFTRGYINNPEETAEVFSNGMFHSGDIARVNEDGNYVILGRKTDMIKINGNRIEPAEIEAAVKRVLGIDWAFAKGFVLPERSFICVYYTADIQIDYAMVREQLLQILPTYMIPSYFIHVDDVPRLPNGKVNRQAFQAPDVLEYQQEYVAPTNELEERLCEVMQQVLNVPRIGIHDDFYLLGGDSLRTIRLVSECNIPNLNVSDIYAHRTPSRIAEAWLMAQLG